MSEANERWVDREPVLYDVENAVATLTLNRPDRMNSVTPQMAGVLFQRLREAEDDPAVRVIILTGSGRAFCAGADTGRLGEVTVQVGEQTMGDQVQRAAFMLGMRKPLIAAINGGCAGIGLALALLCDMRFVSSTATISTAFARRGLIAEYGESWLLPRMIGLANAMDLLLSARKLKGVEAQRMGLANWVSEPSELMNDVYEYAFDLAENVSPMSMAVIKRQLIGHSTCTFKTAMMETDRLVDESLQRPDFKEGVASYIESRKPNFPALTSIGQSTS